MSMNHSSPFCVHGSDKAQKAAGASSGRAAYPLKKGNLQTGGQYGVQHWFLSPVGLLGHLSTKSPSHLHVVKIYPKQRRCLAPKQHHLGVLGSQKLPKFYVWLGDKPVATQLLPQLPGL